jgi:hypothetical protein
MRLTIFLLLFSLSAQGQFIIDSYRFGAPFVPINEPLLDSFPTAAAAYSLRLLRAGYTGNCIEVRRASDNTTQNIGFSGGVLDTAAINTFCGTGATDTCFVRSLYDQSGNSRNFAQTTSANQPRILTSGVINREAGTPAMVFDGSNDWMEIPSSTAMFNFMHDGGNATIFGAIKFGVTADPNAAYLILNNNSTATANAGVLIFYDDRASLSRNDGVVFQITRNVSGNFYTITDFNDKAVANDINLLYIKLDTDNATAANRIKAGINNNAEFGDNTNTNAPSANNASFSLRIGATNGISPTFFLNGSWQELVIYNADQSSNRTAIETNINNFYSIY